MSKNSKDILKEIEDFFSEPPTPNQKAWSIIHDFYNLALTFMKENNISKSDLARKMGKSRSAISQMFRKTPNISIKRMVEIADAIGFDIMIQSDHVKNRVEKVPYIVFVNHITTNTTDDIYLDDIQSCTKTHNESKIESANSYCKVSYGKN